MVLAAAARASDQAWLRDRRLHGGGVDYAGHGLCACGARGLLSVWALGVVRFPVAFSGFANDTAWFLFGALLLGVIATRSGVARRLAYFIMLRVGITYPRILLGLILTDFLLTFVVPSGIALVPWYFGT